MSILNASLEDRYRFEGKPYYLNGTQSLVRLTMLEQRRRAAQGKHTAVYVTGYRGSPLGAFDQAMAGARNFLGDDILLRPAVNEDLAATAVWGTQQLGTFGSGRYDGVSALWYGKGPGVDRTGDVFKHGNLAGSARDGGVLVVAGDDHTCKSSTTAHQSEFALVDAMIPILAPASIEEQMAFGLAAWELSRFAGTWAGMKVVTEIMDSSVSVIRDPAVSFVAPDDFTIPTDGLSLRWPDNPLAQEERLHRLKLPAAIAWARENRLDRRVFGSSRAKLGIVTVGKAYADTRQALIELGIGDARATELGIALYKVAMPWPLEPEGLRSFSQGLEELVIIEEKRALVEDQARVHLYATANPPRIVGKRDENGDWLFPSNGDLGVGAIAVSLGKRLLAITGDQALAARLRELEGDVKAASDLSVLEVRPPHFCPGCPHNTSTKVPEGSKAFAGIGCHYLVQPMERETAGYTQMGGEGGNWIGLSPFSTTSHMFQNIGDGTYFHSGSLAIRAAIAARTNVTYKILFNNAVAMTGGQPVDGELTVEKIAAQVVAEGARRVAIVSDDPSRFETKDLPAGIDLRAREDIDIVQRELREFEGVSVLIYDQTCATELRRLRKRGKLPDPKLAVVINDLVCEGCGDCSKTSNCLAVVPVETEYGRKRAVDLSTCNKDQSCIAGFCPSFVTVKGGSVRKPKLVNADAGALPDPVMRSLDVPVSIIVAGIGGTGVVTIGGIIGMAAHLDGNNVRVMDMTGLAQKGGAVVTHIQLAAGLDNSPIHASKVRAGKADVLLACDLVVGAAPDNLSRISRAGGHIIANEHETATGLFTRDPTFAVPVRPLKSALERVVEPGKVDFFDATDLAVKLVGDAVGANLFLVGFAWQRGLIPVSLGALEHAIALNGVAVALNTSAFIWGRKAALNLGEVQAAAQGRQPDHHRPSSSIEETIERRKIFLTNYQDAKYADRFVEVVQRVRAKENSLFPGETALSEGVANSLFRLMAYKDEYEVARLHAEAGFVEKMQERFEGSYSLTFHLAPPLLARKDPNTGIPRKMAFGPWILHAFHWLAKMKRLRGTKADIFGYTAERRMERQLITDYVALIDNEIVPQLNSTNYPEAIAVVRLAQSIRGFGHIKIRNKATVDVQLKHALQRFRSTPRGHPAADLKLADRERA